MAVSRRFIIIELRKRNIHPGDKPDENGNYADKMCNFLMEIFERTDDDSRKSLKATAQQIYYKLRNFMNLGGSKRKRSGPPVKLDDVLSDSKHKV